MSQRTDSVTLGLAALAALDTHTTAVRTVATRLLAEYAGLPPLLAVHPEADVYRARLNLQPYTTSDALTWGAALGIEMQVTHDEDSSGWNLIRTRGSEPLTIDGVQVHIGSCEQYSPADWAAISTSRTAVAA